MTIKGRMLPLLIKTALKMELKLLLPESQINTVLSKADDEYEGIIKRTPDIGGDKNPFLTTLYIGAYAVALFKVLKDVATTDTIEAMIVHGLSNLDMVKKLVGKKDYLSDESVKDECDKAVWLAAHPSSAGWDFSVKSADKSSLCLTYRRCGLLELVRREGVMEAARLLCKTEALVYGLSGFVMQAVQCMAQGYEVCDLVIERATR